MKRQQKYILLFFLFQLYTSRALLINKTNNIQHKKNTFDYNNTSNFNSNHISNINNNQTINYFYNNNDYNDTFITFDGFNIYSNSSNHSNNSNNFSNNSNNRYSIIYNIRNNFNNINNDSNDNSNNIRNFNNLSNNGYNIYNNSNNNTNSNNSNNSNNINNDSNNNSNNFRNHSYSISNNKINNINKYSNDKSNNISNLNHLSNNGDNNFNNINNKNNNKSNKINNNSNNTNNKSNNISNNNTNNKSNNSNNRNNSSNNSYNINDLNHLSNNGKNNYNNSNNNKNHNNSNNSNNNTNNKSNNSYNNNDLNDVNHLSNNGNNNYNNSNNNRNNNRDKSYNNSNNTNNKSNNNSNNNTNNKINNSYNNNDLNNINHLSNNGNNNYNNSNNNRNNHIDKSTNSGNNTNYKLSNPDSPFIERIKLRSKRDMTSFKAISPDTKPSALVEKLLQNYIKTDPPTHINGTAVKLGIYVISFYSVNEQTMDYSVSMYLRQSWIDPRLNFEKYNLNYIKLRMGVGSWNKIWIPDTFLRNEKGASFHGVTVENRLLELTELGFIWYVTKITATLSCLMTLENFPMDTQVCPMAFESFGYQSKIMYFSSNNDTIETSEELQLPQFTMVNSSYRDCSQTYTTGSYPCLELNFVLKRDLGYFLIQVYVPSVLIVILSWVSFWINVDASPARVSIGLLTVLTTTTMSSGARSTLPRVSYIKAIDVWMIVCLVFVFTSLIEYAVVNVLARKVAKPKRPTNQHPGPILKRAPVNSCVAVQQAQRRKKPFIMRCCKSGSKTAGNHPEPDGKQRARAVDKLSRKIFPFTFTVFNFIYWIYYFKQPSKQA